MNKYLRKRPAFEAVQFLAEESPWPKGVARKQPTDNMAEPYKITTGLDVLPLNSGDWIVTDEDGVRHRYADEAFQALYEPAP